MTCRNSYLAILTGAAYADEPADGLVEYDVKPADHEVKTAVEKDAAPAPTPTPEATPHSPKNDESYYLPPHAFVSFGYRTSLMRM